MAVLKVNSNNDRLDEEIAKIKRENQHLKSLLWVIAKSFGGTIILEDFTFKDLNFNSEISLERDEISHKIIIKAR